MERDAVAERTREEVSVEGNDVRLAVFAGAPMECMYLQSETGALFMIHVDDSWQ